MNTIQTRTVFANVFRGSPQYFQMNAKLVATFKQTTTFFYNPFKFTKHDQPLVSFDAKKLCGWCNIVK
jgi:hypothetical protein